MGCAPATAPATPTAAASQERTDWDSAKRVLGEPGFVDRLLGYERDEIPEQVLGQLRRVTDNPAFTPEQASAAATPARPPTLPGAGGRPAAMVLAHARGQTRACVSASPLPSLAQVGKTSQAARSMCLWVRAIQEYAAVMAVVQPKRARLAAAQAALDSSAAALAERQALLRSARERLAGLERELAAAQKDAALLSFQARPLSAAVAVAITEPACSRSLSWDSGPCGSKVVGSGVFGRAATTPRLVCGCHAGWPV